MTEDKDLKNNEHRLTIFDLRSDALEVKASIVIIAFVVFFALGIVID